MRSLSPRPARDRRWPEPSPGGQPRASFADLLNLEIWQRHCIEGQSLEQLRAFVDDLHRAPRRPGRS